MNIDNTLKKIMGKGKRSPKSFSNMGAMPKMSSIGSMGSMGSMPKMPKMNFPKMNMGLPKSKDWDGDGVPNFKDCQPRNVMRQDKNRMFRDRVRDKLNFGLIRDVIEEFTEGWKYYEPQILEELK